MSDSDLKEIEKNAENIKLEPAEDEVNEEDQNEM